VNKVRPVVRKRPTSDRRVRKTRVSLIQALVELVLEKRYDKITIQDLLNRADVGRSTFYAHYRGKDDLLLRSFEGMLEGLDQALEPDAVGRPRLAPVRELFDHVSEFQPFLAALVRARMAERLYHTGAACMSRAIERRLAALPGAAADAVPPAIRAQALAAVMFALLRLWVDHSPMYSPEQMDEMFHALWRRPGPC
jgi:AcrR family transcriptional regulator